MGPSVTRIVAFVGACVVLATPAGAFNLGYLRDTPLSYFTDEELATFADRLRTSLDESAEDERVQWGEPDNPHAASGSITVIDSEERSDGTICRRVRIENHAGGRFGGGVYRFCRDENGEWALAR